MTTTTTSTAETAKVEQARGPAKRLAGRGRDVLGCPSPLGARDVHCRPGAGVEHAARAVQSAGCDAVAIAVGGGLGAWDGSVGPPRSGGERAGATTDERRSCRP